MKAVLALEDGTIVKGVGFGSRKTVSGELVFNTGMTGYQEALTDPSYNGQILMMTYPLIGNYGINFRYSESDHIQAEGFVVREICEKPSHRFSNSTIAQFLKEHNIPGICEIDTRMLTIKTRKCGTMRAILKTCDESEITQVELNNMVQQARTMPFPEKNNLVSEVSCKEPVWVNQSQPGNPKVVLIDCGTKANIIRELVQRNCTVVRLPYNTTAEEINELKPDGVLISNGPGDPAHPEIMASTVKTIQQIYDRYPIKGICLGHQILALALGARTYKLKFGHRGANHPVKDLNNGRIYITSQNHGFAVDRDTCPSNIEITGINVNDNTVESFQDKKLPIFSVQYHTEASLGPWDSKYLFDKFVKLCQKGKT